MARSRNPKRDEAYKIWIESNKSKLLKDIAIELNVSPSTIRKWKSEDKWDEETKRSAPNEKERYETLKGNANAQGNKGGAPPVRNKNALKTGEFETIYFDMLEDDEKEIVASISNDPFSILNETLTLERVRQRRMLKRIKNLERNLSVEEVTILSQLRKKKEPVEVNGEIVRKEVEKLVDVQVERKQFSNVDKILEHEDALTRINTQITKTIKQMNDLVMNEQKSQLVDAQIEKIKLSNNSTDNNSGKVVFLDSEDEMLKYMEEHPEDYENINQ
ncbi:hypothetical protein BG261_05420 [Floricoccus tropicus]|uniref:PBSX phage terminase small subunit-like N-terminal domain-containing protein n=1 Tax=Floricoccus tropicus TaxID=1859473 RepID=A0A1E8GKR7_9LACT|nr:phage terminase small subunit [Floricoccus tropicus]OFI48829.1 hypothetical protein BG261_05420 [Floricoccus tropicus]